MRAVVETRLIASLFRAAGDAAVRSQCSREDPLTVRSVTFHFFEYSL